MQIAVTKKQLNSLVKGKTVTVKSIGDIHIELDFVDAKKLTLLAKNIRSGKGTRISINMLKNYKVLSSGGKLNIGKAFKKFGNDARDGVMDINHALKSNPMVSAMVKEGATQAVNIGLTALGTATGNPMLGKFAGAVASKGVNAGLSAEGYGFKSKKSGCGINKEINAMLDTATVGLGGVYSNGNFGNAKLNSAERMAHVRSFKQTTGGSFRSAGGSFKPLGSGIRGGSMVAL